MLNTSIISGPPPSRLSGSLDLISLFNLTPLYDQFLRPYLPDTPATTTPNSPKGKEKETRDTPPAPGTPGPTAAGAGAGADGVRSIGKLSLSLAGVKILGEAGPGQGKKAKMEKTYSHLVGDIPGQSRCQSCALCCGGYACEELPARRLS